MAGGEEEKVAAGAALWDKDEVEGVEAELDQEGEAAVKECEVPLPRVEGEYEAVTGADPPIDKEADLDGEEAAVEEDEEEEGDEADFSLEEEEEEEGLAKTA